MPKIDEINFSCYTSLYLFIYALSILTYFTGNLISIVFLQFKVPDWILLGSILASSSIIYGIFSFLKKLLSFIHKKWNIGGYEQFRNEVLIGLVGIAICGITPRISVYFVEMEEFTIFFSLTMFIITAIIIGLHFVNQFNEDYAFSYSLKDSSSWLLIIFHTVILLATVPLEFSQKNWQRTIVIQLCHVSFYVMCTSSTVEIWKLLKGDLKLRDTKKRNPYSGINGLWNRLKTIGAYTKKVQKADTWPTTVTVFKDSGLEADPITVMTRWTAPALDTIMASPEPKEDVERAPENGVEKSVKFTD